MHTPPITIIEDKNLRGIVGPVSAISREMLEDMLDVVGYASPSVVKDINRAFKAKKLIKFVSGRDFRKKLGV